MDGKRMTEAMKGGLTGAGSWRDYLRAKRGFSFLELMLSLSLGLVMMAALISTFIIQNKTFAAREAKAEMTQTARAAMSMITQEVMMAGYSPNLSGGLQNHDDTLPTFCGVVYDPAGAQLEVRADLNGNGKIVITASGSNPNRWTYDENERIVYKKIGNQLKRKTGKGYFQPFAESVHVFSFRCLDRDGSLATRSKDIQNVEIILETQKETLLASSKPKGFRLVSATQIRNSIR